MLTLLATPVFKAGAQGYVRTGFGDRGMVVSESAYASRVGRDVLARGGNAVDAAIATAFALAVTWPEAGNIGGGGFMLIRPADGSDPVCIDYREIAPLAAKVDTFDFDDSRHSRKIVGVPGTLRGLELAHRRHGSLPWASLVAPAARLAAEGFSVDAFLARSANRVLAATDGDPDFAELHRVYGKPDQSAWGVGDVMTLPDLARTLRQIAAEGPDAFYTGPIAELLLREMAKRGGLIRGEDLRSYRAKARAPIIGTFNGCTVLGAPPPSSGGIALVQALNLVEALRLSTDKDNAQTLHLLAEVSRRVFVDRAKHLGDPDFVTIPAHLTSKDYARELAKGIDARVATDSVALASEIPLADESADTTHFSVVDKDGMAVSNTYTIESSWGSRIVVPGAGFLLNNEMGDFNWVRGHTDKKGRIGTASNLIEPGKRMLSSQCPVIVCKDNRPLLVTGSPGGRTIINTVFNVVLNLTHFDMPAPLAVQAKRFHHQWLPDTLYLEDAAEPPFALVREELEARGHKITNRVSQGSAHSIWVDPQTGSLVGVADYRRGGRPAGVSSVSEARWDFGGRKGGALRDQVAAGAGSLRWSRNIAGCSLDGSDGLKVRRGGTESADRAHARLSRSKEHAVVVEFDGIRLAGPARDEGLRFAFTATSGDGPNTTASMTLARNGNNEIVLSGAAAGEGATAFEPTAISSAPCIGEPIAIRLSVDQQQGRYWVELRRALRTEFELIGEGKTDPTRSIEYGRLQVINDFSQEGEYARIDSIEFESRRSSPMASSRD